jgi:hypothetical protein
VDAVVLNKVREAKAGGGRSTSLIDYSSVRGSQALDTAVQTAMNIRRVGKWSGVVYPRHRGLVEGRQKWR